MFQNRVEITKKEKGVQLINSYGASIMIHFSSISS